MIFKRFSIIALLCGILTAYGTPGEAVLITWDFTAAPSTISGTGYGNVYSFTVDGLTATVSAWGLTGSSGLTFQAAQVARTAYGLGSCNQGEGVNCTSNPRVDNVGQLEFLLFQFSAPVDLKQIILDPGGTVFDLDVSYWTGNLTGSLTGTTLAGLSGLGLGSQQNFPNTAAGSALPFSLTGSGVTALLFGTRAALTTCSTSTTDPGCDRFYIKSLTDDLSSPSAVPEPGTLLLLGSGLVGVAAFGRRLRKQG
jgi:hypothetical protein